MGIGQEGACPVAQFEKLWGDMTALPQVACESMIALRIRVPQLRKPAQLDAWVRDGSADFVTRHCAFAH